jgi:hypothetical protein
MTYLCKKKETGILLTLLYRIEQVYEKKGLDRDKFILIETNDDVAVIQMIPPYYAQESTSAWSIDLQSK